MRSLLLLFNLPTLALAAPQPHATSVNVTSYAAACHAPRTVCLASIALALADARAAFQRNPDELYTISLPAGTFDFSDETTIDGTAVKAAIDFSGIFPGTRGALHFAGAGMDQTTLITSNEVLTLNGRNVSHLHISGITFERPSPTVTQGKVVSSKAGQVTVEIPPGFPTPLELFNNISTQGRYLRVYDNTNPLDPTLNLDASNQQISWGNRTRELPPTGSGRLWTLSFSKHDLTVPAIYTGKNQIVCIKIKAESSGYSFSNITGPAGTDVGFDDVRWLDTSRGVFRNITDVYVTNSRIERRPPIAGQAFCISTPGGGPQIGQPGDTQFPNHGTRIDHLVVQAPGDDGIAIFNDPGATSIISHSTVTDSFARNINLYKSPGVRLLENSFRGCSPADANHPEYKACVVATDATPPR